jgi:hypothetical protein
MSKGGLNDLGQACLSRLWPHLIGRKQQQSAASYTIFPEGKVQDQDVGDHALQPHRHSGTRCTDCGWSSPGRRPPTQRHAFSTVRNIAFMSAKQEPDESITDWEKRALNLYQACHPKVGLGLWPEPHRDLLDRFILGLYDDKIRDSTWAGPEVPHHRSSRRLCSPEGHRARQLRLCLCSSALHLRD